MIVFEFFMAQSLQIHGIGGRRVGERACDRAQHAGSMFASFHDLLLGGHHVQKTVRRILQCVKTLLIRPSIGPLRGLLEIDYFILRLDDLIGGDYGSHRSTSY